MTTLRLERIYGANTSPEELEAALQSEAYARCQKIMNLVEALRFPAGRKRPDGKDYQARIPIHDAVQVIMLALKGFDE